MAEEYFTFKEDGNLYREDGTIVDLGEEVTSDDTVVDRRVHRYFPDFYIKVKESHNKIKSYLIEVKPKKQTKPPVTI